MWLWLGGWDCDKPTSAQIAMKLNVQPLASDQIVPTPTVVTQTITINIYEPALLSGVGISSC